MKRGLQKAGFSLFMYGITHVPSLVKNLTFEREYPVCWTYGGGGVHHSLLLWGLGSSLALTCIKSECPGYVRGGGGGVGSGV